VNLLFVDPCIFADLKLSQVRKYVFFLITNIGYIVYKIKKVLKEGLLEYFETKRVVQYFVQIC